MSELSSFDNSSEDLSGISCIHKNIMDFIRALETKQFQAVSRQQKFIIENDQSLTLEWNKIENTITELIEDGSTEPPGEYTFLLSLHNNHKLKLLKDEMDALFYCIEPGLIIDIFEKGLVKSNCAHLLKRIEKNCIFMALENMDEFPYSFETMMSLSLLLYKSQCKSKRHSIMKSINEQLSEFILHEAYDENVKTIAMRKLLESVVLNGIMSRSQFNQFLAKTCFTDDADDDDEFSDDGMDLGNFQRRANHQTISVGEKILMKNTNLFHDMFPLSLKNLCRIFIKNSLTTYNQYSVNVLDIPVVMKKFLLFDDEIKEILKQTERQTI
jgi:hypothetical protein